MGSNSLERRLLIRLAIYKFNGLSYALIMGVHNQSITDLKMFSDPNLAQFC